MRALALVLVLAACPGSGGDGNHAIEAMIEVKLEMRAAIDELKQASIALDAARAEIDRARGDLDRSRRALDKAFEKESARASAGPRVDDFDVPVPPITALDPALAAGITCIEEGLCTIKRSVFDTLAADPSSLPKQARVVPATRDGATLGFKLYGVRPGSLPKLIGIKNGDLISAVNGKPLRTIDDVMTLATSLRKAKKLDLVGERKGEPLSITITITDG
jgi:hypothetical protein